MLRLKAPAPVYSISPLPRSDALELPIGNVAPANLAYAATIPSANACFFSIAICASLGLCPKKGSIKAEGWIWETLRCPRLYPFSGPGI